MTLNRIRFGDYIKPIKIKCGISNLTVDDVSGINRDKEFFEPSKQVGADTSSYKVVPPNCFACNIMHVGRDVVLPIALNTTPNNKIVSPAYIVFEWTGDNVLLKEYLFMMLKSEEKDRYFWFHCDSSVRDGMDWDAFCDIELEVPSIEIQKKYVAIYEGLLANLRSYEKGIDDLKLVCDGYIEDLRKKYRCEYLDGKIEMASESNQSNVTTNVQGVGANSAFMPTKANLSGVNLDNYTVVRNNDFAYNPSRINLGSIALYQKEKPCIVSPMYVVFKVTDESKLLPKYLMLWFTRKEFLRSTSYYAIGSVRDTFSFDLMKEVKIPIPSLDLQENIIKIFDVYNDRKENIDRLDRLISSICPTLIRGSIVEANKKGEA